MRAVVLLLLLGTGTAASDSAVQANFVRIEVTAPASATVRAVWKPYVGAVGGPGSQQAAIRRMMAQPIPPDSLRRWRDPLARDTVVVKTPASFEVDMNGGPITIEVVGHDSVHVDAWQVPGSPPGVTAWGRAFEVSSEGHGPSVTRRAPQE